jgi:hypothetical protein
MSPESSEILRRYVPYGRVAIVFAITFGRARLGVGPANSQGFDDVW